MLLPIVLLFAPLDKDPRTGIMANLIHGKHVYTL